MSGPVFIVGIGSSGTTLLRNLLWASPHCYSTHETGFYQHEYRSPAWEAAVRRKLNELRRHFPQAGCRPEYEPDRVLGMARTLGRADFVRRHMESLAAHNTGTRWIEKTPSHLSHCGEIKGDFPDAVICCVVRNPGDTIHSLSRRTWFRGDYAAACRLWLDGYKAFLRNAALIDRFVSYDDLCLYTEKTVRKAFADLGVPYANEAETFHETLKRQGAPAIGGLRPITPGSVGRAWRETTHEERQTRWNICGF